jgi:phosphoglycerate dehydrogenase-like enzyme
MSALTVLVTEPVMSRFADVLTRRGASEHEWVFAFTEDAELDRARQRAEVLVCSSATAELVASMPRLRLIHVTGAGYDKVPLTALPDRVAVANTFHHGRSIAEHVLMVAMMLSRKVLAAHQDMRRGVWRNAIVDQSHPFGETLEGRTLGIVGFGEIGTSVARLGAAIGMRVAAVRRDPSVPAPTDLTDVWMGSEDQLPELLAMTDILVLTVPLTDNTRGLIDAAAFAQMKESAVLINVSRGQVVDERALHEALSTHRIAGAGIDVWWRNPRDVDNPPPSHLDFTGFDNVVLTPHQSGHAEQVFSDRASDITDNVDALAAGRPLHNVVREPSQA